MKYATPKIEFLELEATSICCTLGVSGPEGGTGGIGSEIDVPSGNWEE